MGIRGHLCITAWFLDSEGSFLFQDGWGLEFKLCTVPWVWVLDSGVSCWLQDSIEIPHEQEIVS